MGISIPKEEAALDTGDWRTQLTPDSRQKIVNKIVETLKRNIPLSGSEEINELRRIAARFEEKTLTDAISQTDYLRRISMKMLTMETRAQNAAAASSSIPAANYSLPFNSGLLFRKERRRPWTHITGELNCHQIHARRMPTRIMEALKKHVPTSDQQGNNELMRIAVSFEELIFSTAMNQVDYFRRISFKVMPMRGGN